METNNKPMVLCVIDGFGLTSSWKGNAIFSAAPKNFFDIWSSYPHYLLTYSDKISKEDAVYDNPGRYLTSIFSGKEIESEREYIDKHIEDSLVNNEVLNNAFQQASEKSSSLHLIGNLSGDEGKYSNLKHLFALLDLAKEKNVFQVFIHLILDDTGGGFDKITESLHKLETKLSETGLGQIASICGLNYLREKDNMSFLNFSKAYRTIVEGRGNSYLSAGQAINK
ncbi:MAG: hypothetical protein M1308_12535, partial [Actinobacteria bacterium]|nr:hypothetical protein [Actinomycetota bacterium]